jgi:hypothetical protein
MGPWTSCTCAEPSRLPTTTQQQVKSGRQRQSTPAPLLPPARLQRQTIRFGFAQISL